MLKRVRKAAPPPPDDTEVENSDIEQQLRAKASKKAGAVKVQMTRSDDLID